MGSAIIGALRAVLGLDTAQFENNADRAKNKAGGLKQALLSTAAALTPVAAGAAAATIAVQGFAIGMRLAAEAAKYADDIAAQSYKLGVSAEYLQAFNFAAGESDVEVTKAVDALSSLTAAVGALQSGVGDGRIREAMKELGISQKQIDSIKTVEQALPLLADHIARLGTITEQTQFAKKFGLEALLPMLRQGSAGIQEMMQKGRDLGVVLSNDVVDRLADMSREMEIADERARTAGNALGASLTPAMVIFKNATADAISWLSRFIDQLNRVDKRATETLRRQRDAARDAMLNVQTWASGPNRDEALAAAQKRVAELDRELNRRFDEEKKRASEPVASSGGGGGGGGGGGESNSRKSASKAEESWESLFYKAQSNRAEIQAREFEQQFAKSVIDPSKLQEPISTMVSEGILDGMEASKKAFSDQIYSATRGGLEALRYGGLKGFGDWLASVFARSLDDKIASGVAGLFSKGSGLSKSGGIMSALKSFVGFDSTGGFQVGGIGGTDSQLRTLRLTPGERVSVTRGNDLGGRLNQIFHVNAQGAVLAADLVSEMQRVGAVAAGVGGEVGSQAAQAQAAVASRYRIARS